jgi:hypothetical protein
LNEAPLAVYISLFIFTAGIMYLYFERKREATIEYVRVKRVLDEIIMNGFR